MYLVFSYKAAAIKKKREHLWQARLVDYSGRVVPKVKCSSVPPSNYKLLPHTIKEAEPG